jgi:DMSO reductase family type II enzyme chaperone
MIFKMLAAAFAYPDGETSAALKDGTLAENLDAAVSALPNAAALRKAVLSLKQAGQSAWGVSLAEEYTYLFLRQSIAPYESSYLDRVALGNQEMADVTGFYRAFGFEVGEKTKELPDHIGAELEFLSILCLKEAYALENGWAEQATVCQMARRDFVAQHLGHWLPVFAARVRERARLPFYPALAAFAASVVQVSEDGSST